MNKSKLKVFGLDVSHLSSNKQLLLLASGAMFTSLGFAYLQEKVTHIEGFHHYDLMTFLTSLTFMVLGFTENFLTRELNGPGCVRKASLKSYFLLSMCTMGGMYFTNLSLTYLNYTTRIVFKSSKIIPVMLVGVFFQAKKYTGLEYGSAFVLVSGIVCFTLADAKESPTYSPLGLIMISSGVILDALTSNYEEKEFFNKLNCKPAEVMAYSSFFATIFATIPMVLSAFKQDDADSYVDFITENPEAIYLTVAFSALGYCSSLFILMLIKTFGATNAEIVKSLRKIFSVLISFVAFGKPFTSFHFVGILLFVGSMMIGIKVKQEKARKKKLLKEADVETQLLVS